MLREQLGDGSPAGARQSEGQRRDVTGFRREPGRCDTAPRVVGGASEEGPAEERP